MAITDNGRQHPLATSNTLRMIRPPRRPGWQCAAKGPFLSCLFSQTRHIDLYQVYPHINQFGTGGHGKHWIMLSYVEPRAGSPSLQCVGSSVQCRQWQGCYKA